MIIKNRHGNEENIEEDKFTIFLYQNVFGRLLLKVIYNPWFSRMGGYFLDSRISTLKIKKYIKKYHIIMDDYEEKKYHSFNDFFTRKVKSKKRPINTNKNILISPCDAKLKVYPIEANALFNIKNSIYRVKDLINDESLIKKFLNGYVFVFRLCVDDYHHYSYIDDGYQDGNHFINGVLNTVRPIAVDSKPIFIQNQREWTLLHTKNFGDVLDIEVGALMVGKIVNLDDFNHFKKGDEKGYFKFGGSTIILITNDQINIDRDILKNSANNIETIVKMGEKIGIKKKQY